MNRVFDFPYVNTLEKPLASDIDAMLSSLNQSQRFFIEKLYTPRASLSSALSGTPVTGFLADGFWVVPSNPPTMNVIVKAGLGFQYTNQSHVAIGGVDSLDDRRLYKPLVLDTDVAFTVPASPPAGQSRYDIIEVQSYLRTEDPSTRLTFNAGAGDFVPGLQKKTLAMTLSNQQGSVVTPNPSTAPLSYVQGVAAATGAQVEPTTTNGYTKIARILVGEGATTLDSNVIVDNRRILFPYNQGRVSGLMLMPASGGSIKPTLQSLVAPPGVQVAALGTSVVGAQCGVVIVAGGQLGSAVGIFNTVPVGFFADRIYAAQTLPAQVQQAGPAQQALLANPLAAHPTLKIAVGQWYVVVGCYAIRALGGATDVTLTPSFDPAIYNFTVDFWY